MPPKNTSKPAAASSKAEEAVRKRPIWDSWAVLPAKTRLRISLGVCAVAFAGMVISDQLEVIFPPELPPPTPAPASGDASR
ncbi:hypothetical protein HETIRDRAFT_447732 [Heterobasidion irregulare TC 32-1]|uniref:Uncharacterized protein n=1 Tax=Heterobasidion irregulare (strain TC 32-1) TaxID=747525 RepID=W4KMS0_HETIT|nr:uncharacterized protein HETIRDRAFT_447732 [Heterobasidion irregulare TC 32-1]ETW87143.1 hypothetical protein HETIRDRAFT_447732 [Heterobasidion irregulare TC 32-1]